MILFKKILRIAYFVFITLLTCIGVGLAGVGPILPGNRERMVARVKTEQVDKKKSTMKEGREEIFG